MIKTAKWVKPSHAHEPLAQVAAEVIRERLELVWKYAPLAAKKWDDNPEFVHQMRVATRRSAAALALFAELLPRKKTKHMLKRLKRLRKASGEARDLDVLCQRLRRDVKAGRTELKPTLAALRQWREQAQSPLIEQVAELAQHDLPQAIDALCQRIRWRSDEPEPTYAQAARRLLGIELDNFFIATQENLDDNHKLHALRIAGKQLRYAMELLAGAFNDDFRERHYEPLREIQDQLGAINDHVVAQLRYGQWAATADHDVAETFLQLAEEEGRLAADRRDDFCRWWANTGRGELEESLRSAAGDA